MYPIFGGRLYAIKKKKRKKKVYIFIIISKYKITLIINSYTDDLNVHILRIFVYRSTKIFMRARCTRDQRSPKIGSRFSGRG